MTVECLEGSSPPFCFGFDTIYGGRVSYGPGGFGCVVPFGGIVFMEEFFLL
jgi:hypothetical protein